MNRKEIKGQAQACLKETGREPKKVTLIFLLCAAAIIILRLVLTELAANMDTGGNYISDSLIGASKSLVLTYGVALVFQLLLVLLCAGYTAVALELWHRNPVGPGSLLAGFRLSWRVIGLYVIMMLFVSVWAYAFSMPLSYLLVMDAYLEEPLLSEEAVMLVLVIYVGVVMFLTTYRYRTAFFMMMDNPGLSPRQALRQATAVNKGHRKALFLMDLSYVPWILLSVLTCGILLIWKLPYIISGYAGAYEYMMSDYAQRQSRLLQMQEQMRQDRHNGMK